MDDTRQLPPAPRPDGPRLAAPPEHDPPAPLVPLRLVLHPGGLCVELTKPEMLVGRHSGADVRLSLPDVSRRHCRFVFADGAWRVFDLNSLNGVFVNGERLQEATIFHGDRLRIGSLTFEAEVGTDAPAVKRPTRVHGEDAERRKAS